MLVSLGVKNFRSFREKTDIKLKPITVFVGKNSCGKSSFLRLFPLFRQSIEAHTTGPILWFGRYVDFGDFNNVLFKGAEEKEITFYFKIKCSHYIKDYDDFFKNKKGERKLTDFTVELTIEPNNQKTKYKNLNIFSDNFKIFINQQPQNTIKVLIENFNKKEEFNISKVYIKKSGLSYLLPVLQYETKWGENSEFFSDKYLENLFYRDFRSFDYLYSSYKELNKYLSNKVHESKVLPVLSDITIKEINEKGLYNFLKKNLKNNKDFINDLNKNYSKIYEAIAPKLLLANLNPLLLNIDEDLNITFSNIRYIAPIRAITERFYRFQDLQIDEMDHTGSNMAMLLNSLSSKDKKLFGEWVKKNFNFSVEVDESGPHYAINIIDENAIKYNISDMGFGYSQLLPIIMSLWLETKKKETKKNQQNNDLFFVIEQPELHLHPAYQFQLGKLFSKIIAKASQSNIKIIVETHSQYFINALGESVEQKQISKDDISIVVFNKKDKETEIQEAYFDEDGTLENWPIGFFSGE